MTPTLAELLLGNFLALADAPPPESMGEFMAGKLGVVAMICVLGAQEAERGPAARAWENAAFRALFARTADRYDGTLGGRLAAAAATVDEDASVTGMDASNASLRRVLIDLHIAAEDAGDRALDREILALYGEMAEQRRLDLPPLPAA